MTHAPDLDSFVLIPYTDVRIDISDVHLDIYTFRMDEI
ncbi:hypothetical protein LCGC14_2011970 [marine sediment metagenome]|uniref:Uncharacterized protein n=1 Tax=marine sediment metagenome TaxID=412755 RepID=A0A0F9HDH8_9ZZZZ